MGEVTETIATYASVEGAQAFIAKEIPHHQTRTASVLLPLGDISLSGKRILDVGCGFGRDVSLFRAMGAEAYGVDVSKPLLAEAAQRYGHPEWFEQANLLTLDTPPFGGGFDVLWLCQVLVHVPRLEMPRLLTRMVSWLAPGGYMVINTKRGEGERVMTNLGEHLPRLMVYYSLEELTHVLNKCGCEVEWSEDGVKLPYGDVRLALRARKMR